MNIEKAVLVGVEFQNDAISIEISLEELAQLASTAGAVVTGTVIQKREKPDLKYFIGKGKLDELIALAGSTQADLVIFDNELHPSQERNLEEALGMKVIDRTELILDIFAQHAASHEGRLQVKLAQSEFMLTRLSGKGIMMSRLGGGIGTRGPGETKLEKDRRNIRKEISELKKSIGEISASRHTRRSSRISSGMKSASIVGYTNAGKSTLLNALTNANALVENKLFATLDTTTRRLFLNGKTTILISDTVGFIQKLPHQLVDAFKATLDEVTEADLLIHVVDASSPYLENQIASVYTVLEEIGAIGKPMITVFNKCDLLKKGTDKNLQLKYSPCVEVSALKKSGLDGLKEAIYSCLQLPRQA